MKHTVANSVDFAMPKRTVQFYKSTRPQAPARHKDSPELVDLVECSVCRGLFFEQDAAMLRSHRRWHDDHRTEQGFVPMPCGDAQDAYQGRYQFAVTCDVCGEDLCPCGNCQARHVVECSDWCKVKALLESGEDEKADALADSIVALRSGH